MKNIRVFSAILVAAAMTCGSIVLADDATDKKAETKPCCEATVDAGKKCDHECCKKAAEEGKVCEKCHPKKDEEKKSEEKKADPKQ